MDAGKMEILICHDDAEKKLAEALKECIEKVLAKLPSNGSCGVDLCGSETDWKGMLGGLKDKDNDWVFVLCSPYSIRQSWVNFVTGAATIIAGSGSLAKSRIIPICHSGQKSKDLPHYLMARQAMDVHHEDFLKALARTLSPELDFESKMNGLEQCKTLLENAMKEIYNNADSAKGSPASNEEYGIFKLVRKGENIEIALENATTTSADDNSRLLSVHQMRSFLTSQPDPAPVQAAISIGIQNCLYDGENIFVGLRIDTEVDTGLKSYSGKGVFEPGYKVIKSQKDFKAWHAIYNKDKKERAKRDSDIYKSMEKRIEAFGTRLWHIRSTQGLEGIATVYVNNSPPVPRYEIGVWKYIDISEGGFKNRLEKFGIVERPDNIPSMEYGKVQNQGGKEQIEYWIWVKNGEIFYWSFPDESIIPRFSSLNSSEGSSPNPVLVTTEYMSKAYGRPEKFTPLAPDDVLGIENVVKDHFSAAARALLQCF
jgi:hypothetical protein